MVIPGKKKKFVLGNKKYIVLEQNNCRSSPGKCMDVPGKNNFIQGE
jgi:hypothetical protein